MNILSAQKAITIKKNKPVFAFFTKVIILYTLFALCIEGYLFVFYSPKVFVFSFLNGFIAFIRSIQLHDRFGLMILYSAEYLLKALSFPTEIQGMILRIKGTRGIILHFPCIGFYVMAAFLSLMLAYPHSFNWIKKAWIMIMGLLIIQLLNVLRIFLLVIHNQTNEDFFIDHHDLFNAVISCFICAYFYWTTKIIQPSRKAILS